MILTTNLYEKSFRSFLGDLNNDFFSINSDYITRKIISINNLGAGSKQEFELLQNKVVEKFQDVNFVFTHEYVEKCRDIFRVELSDKNPSYLYSIHNYTSLLLGIESDIDMVLTLGADCKLSDNNLDRFIEKSIEELNSNPSLLSTTLPWSDNFEETGIHEETIYPVNQKSQNFYLSKVMSDQVFLCSSKKILNVVDFHINEVIHPYPFYVHGGFENRMCNFMIKNNYYRGIFKGFPYYDHNSY